jgi:uncharacterized membrane protein
MFDIIFYILFDCAVEGSVNTKLPKGLRYTLLGIVTVMFLVVVGGLIWIGVERLDTSKGAGAFFIVSGIVLFLFGIFWYWSTMRKMKEKAAQNKNDTIEDGTSDEKGGRDDL